MLGILRPKEDASFGNAERERLAANSKYMFAELVYSSPAESAPAIDPWIAAMRRGDFAQAWQISDAHLAWRAQSQRCEPVPRHLQHIWNGQCLTGKRVLVRCYHGLGDTVQFIRFAAPLRRIAKEVVAWVQPRLLSLIGTVAGIDRVLPLHDGELECDYDIDIEVMELPHALRVNAKTIPVAVPYFFPLRTLRQPRRLAAEPAIGLVWKAGDGDPRRSLDPEMLSPLAAMAGLRLYSLQRGRSREAARMVAAQDISTDDVETLASTICALDLVIAVDTFVAHLAGALGAPVWTLLHADCDWRWMENANASIWYPTMRLFRQERPGDWSSVITKVRTALQERFTLAESASGPLEQTNPSNVPVL